MQVVNAVEVHVLCMPSKRSLPHAKVEVGSVDTLNNDATLLLHHIQQGVEVTDIPLLNTLEQFYWYKLVFTFRKFDPYGWGFNISHQMALLYQIVSNSIWINTGSCKLSKICINKLPNIYKSLNTHR